MTASEVIAALPVGAQARECVLCRAEEGYRLMILMDDQCVAVDFKGAASRNIGRAWDILVGAVFQSDLMQPRQ